jgi:predicted phage baseplate assembly protein
MNLPCDCCEGPDVLTPLSTANRPGLSQLRYRVGTHATFFETMQARLSSAGHPELVALKTREKRDPSIALLDAWATVGDVLTFYQERIANESYLRTARERRSVLELARLIGYALRPGVAASVYLAYSLEKDAGPVEIPRGARANSVPAPGEQMQSFETAEPLTAHVEWNEIKPRLTQPQTADAIENNGLYLKGTSTNLNANDPLLINVGTGLVRIESVDLDNDKGRTRVMLRHLTTTPPPPSASAVAGTTTAGNGSIGLLDVIKTLKLPPSVPPAGAKQLPRNIATAYGPQSDTIPRLLTTLQPSLVGTLYTSWKNLPPLVEPQIEVHALRVTAAPFGHNAPLRQTGFDEMNKRAVMGEWEIENPWNRPADIVIAAPRGPLAAVAVGPTPDYHKPRELYLDSDYEIAPDSMVVIEETDKTKKTNKTIIVKAVDKLVHRSLMAYGLSGKTVQVDLPAGAEWIADAPEEPFSTVRNTRVFAGSEKLDLAEEPVTDEVAGSEIELGDLYAALEPGRWLIVAGERSDIKAGSDVVAGVKAAELVMIAAIQQRLKLLADGTPLPGDRIHTFVTLAKPLAYKYKRDTVTIYGNVIRATHGEQRREVLGSGDATRVFQEFTLKQPPLTYVSAPTVLGVESTLEVRVNDVKWHEVDSFVALGPNDRNFITRTRDDAKSTVVFGNGVQGARLPTGQENAKAAYRNGIGKPGNVKAGQITLLNTRPLGVKEVINPIRASGGADKESRDSARKNVSLAVMALDRLVSTRDYADFARGFAGVGKAAALRLTDGRRQVVQVTIAGADDIPIEPTSELYRNLYDALHRFGDPYLPIYLLMRERLAVVMSANVRVHPDYLWEFVEARIRAALLDAFGFEKVELGEDLLLAEAIRVVQRIPGVLYVDVDRFDAISEEALLASLTQQTASNLKLNDRITVEPPRVVFEPLPVPQHRIAAAQLAYLAPDVPDMLILQESRP